MSSRKASEHINCFLPPCEPNQPPLQRGNKIEVILCVFFNVQLAAGSLGSDSTRGCHLLTMQLDTFGFIWAQRMALRQDCNRASNDANRHSWIQNR